MSLAPGTLPNAARRLARLRPDPLAALIVAAALLGAALALARTLAYGAGLGGDSASYIYAANNLLDGIRFEAVTVNGVADPRPFALWPPLYPAALAAASLGIFDPFEAAGPLSAAAFGLTILAAGFWMRRHLQSRFLAACGCLALALSLPLGWTAHLAAPESLFILFFTLALIQAHKHLRTGDWPSLFWAAAFTAFAMDAKYMGVAVMATIAGLLILRRGVALRPKALRAAAYVLISCAPVGAWAVRNFILVGGFLGSGPLLSPQGRAAADASVSLPDLLRDLLSLFGAWLFLVQGRTNRDSAATLAAVLLLALAVAVAYAFFRAARRKAAGRDDWNPILLFGGFALLFAALHLAAASTGYAHDGGYDERRLTLLYAPLLFAGVFLLDKLALHARRWEESDSAGGARSFQRSGLWILAAAGLLAWLALAGAASVREIRQANAEGLRGTENAAFFNSDVVRYARENPFPSRAFTNWRTLLILRTDPSARMHRWGQGPTLEDVRDWIAQYGDGEHIAWFYESSWDTVRNFDASGLRELPGLEKVADLRDGVIFRVTPRSASAIEPSASPAAASDSK